MVTGFPLKHPYWFTALLAAMIAAVFLAAGTAAAVLRLPSSTTSEVFLVANLVLVLLGAVLLTRLRWWRIVGFRALAAPGDLRLYWLPLAPALVNLANGISVTSFDRAAYFLVLAGAIGFHEEVFFRGLILRALAPRGLWRAAIASSIVFALLHSLNVLAGADLLSTVLQVGYTLAIGFGFAAVTLRTGVIWPLVVAHALIDFAHFLSTNGADSAGASTVELVLSAVWIVAFTTYGVVLLRGGHVADGPREDPHRARAISASV